MSFVHQAQSFADDVHVVAEVADFVLRDGFEFAVESHFRSDAVDQVAQGEHGVGRELFGANVIGYFFARVANDGGRRDVMIQHVRSLGGDGDEILRLLIGDGVIDGVRGGYRADEDEHDEAHAFLAVIGTVEEADSRAGDHEQDANPEGRRFVALRRLIQCLVGDQFLGNDQEHRGEEEADDGRKNEGLSDVGSLAPIDAAGTGLHGHQLVGDADADDRTDKGVGAGGGKSEPPGTEIPDDRRNEQGKDHGEAGASADLQNQFHGEKGHDAESHRAAGCKYTEEIPHAGPDHGDVRFHGVGVDDGGDGVCGVVKAVYEFESQGGEEGDAKERVGQPALGMDARKVCEQVAPDVDEADYQHHNANENATSSGSRRHLGVKNGRSCCHSSPLGVWEIQQGETNG